MGRNVEPTPDLIKSIAKLEQRISNLETGNRIGNTSIDSGEFSVKNGSFVVYDNTDNERVKLGLLDDSTYGIQVTNAASEVLNLAPLAGITANDETGSTVITSTTYAPAPDGLGPSVTAYIGPARRCLVFVGCHWMGINAGERPEGGMCANITKGATTILAANGLGQYYWTSPQIAGDIYQGAAGQMHLFGPTIFSEAGLYKFEAYYLRAINNVYAFSRNIIVIPF